MNHPHLDAFFRPRRIAMLGVSPNPESVGGRILSNLVGGGFPGVVYPVSPSQEAVLGIPCHRSLSALPHPPDLAILCAPAPEVPDLVRACGEAGVRGAMVVSAGFRETGAEGRALEERLRAEAARFEGMRLMGPNCLGVLVPGSGLNASFAPGLPRQGDIAFLSQSGALCAAVLDWAREERIGFSAVVSVGNALDVGFGDLIDYFGDDEGTHSIVLYLESIGNARRFMTAARAFARSKPIVAYRAGRFPRSAEAAASHTGALATGDDVYQAAFDRAGIARVFDIGEIFACTELIGRRRTPRGSRLAVVTNAGGPGVMAMDALLAAGGEPAILSEATRDALREALPPAASVANPVDVLGDARPKRLARALEIVLADKGVDAVLVILTPQAMTRATAAAEAVGRMAETSRKPLLASWLGGESMREGMRVLSGAGIATYATPEQAVRAFMTLVAYARNLETLYETPRDIPVEFPLDRREVRAEFDRLVADQGPILGEEVSKTLLSAFGIPSARPLAARSADEAVRFARHIGYPVVLKVLSPDVTHKSDLGGVVLDLWDGGAVRAAWDRIHAEAARLRPGARVEGVTVQPMIRSRGGVEMILGARKDPVFGTVILAGLGGTAAEVLRDRALGFPPLNERLARRMLESLRAWPLLRGFRGSPPLAVDALIEALIRLSYLCAEYPEVLELDVNPLLVTETGVTALDARVVLDPAARGRTVPPYDHLALHPYPEELVQKVALGEASLVLRPIRPEDEPLWMEMLGACSRDTIWARFRYAFPWTVHDVATRFCTIDYAREIALVAEHDGDGRRELVGVGRLVAGPDPTEVEYAVLVRDAWQNRGLGSLLTDACMQIARGRGYRRVVATTTPDNPRMLAVLRRRGFDLRPDPTGGTVDVEKALEPEGGAVPAAS
ncbi:MAG: bifunctional acetate--CoA ligase family protein/GNAT family N-acetyltransferase [Planctomycetes bacterium]|nr:bifunctional acetate--CoA ligase family protein/GNAT family N-acetyltransferase [Planctomycetota bacterium]